MPSSQVALNVPCDRGSLSIDLGNNPSEAGAAWPEPVQRVQVLAETNVADVPSQYIRPPSQRAGAAEAVEGERSDRHGAQESVMPVVDLSDLLAEVDIGGRQRRCLDAIGEACKEWGFFQVINHGIPLPILDQAQRVSREFFQESSMDEKQRYSNDPLTYEGYGSRVGVSKGAILDWGDYFFLNVLPVSSRNMRKWPTKPDSWRSTIDEYSSHVHSLCRKLLAALSINLGLVSSSWDELLAKDHFHQDGTTGGLERAFCQRPQTDALLVEEVAENTGLDMGLRINYYPSCPQPDLTLGLSSHSDPGGLTVLLQDDNVPGLQVKHHDAWVMVQPIKGALIINIGDQIQILSNGIYKSVEHRVLVNRYHERLSLACFINPTDDTVVAPLKELVHSLAGGGEALYGAMTFREYRSLLRSKGTNGKGHLSSIASPVTPASTHSLSKDTVGTT